MSLWYGCSGSQDPALQSQGSRVMARFYMEKLEWKYAKPYLLDALVTARAAKDRSLEATALMDLVRWYCDRQAVS